MAQSVGLPTMVEHYVSAALRHTVIEAEADDGVLCAYVPQAHGVIAYGANVHECSTELYVRLQDWVETFLRGGIELPVIDGIDLNQDAARLLATYGPEANDRTTRGRVFDTEE